MITEFNAVVVPLEYYWKNTTIGFIFKNKRKPEETLERIASKIHVDTSTLESTLFKNEPIKGVRIVPSNLYINYLGSLSYRLEDPRGFSINVPAYAIGSLIENCTITNGVISEEIMYDITHKYTQPKILVKVNGDWI